MYQARGMVYQAGGMVYQAIGLCVSFMGKIPEEQRAGTWMDTKRGLGHAAGKQSAQPMSCPVDGSSEDGHGGVL